MNRLRLNRHVARAILLLAALVLLLSVPGSYAAYRINRPVALADEPILQTYLHGEVNDEGNVHSGIARSE
jgi:hypothetical protein